MDSTTYILVYMCVYLQLQCAKKINSDICCVWSKNEYEWVLLSFFRVTLSILFVFTSRFFAFNKMTEVGESWYILPSFIHAGLNTTNLFWKNKKDTKWLALCRSHVVVFVGRGSVIDVVVVECIFDFLRGDRTNRRVVNSSISMMWN